MSEPHLADDRLLAVLDGEAEPSDVAHEAACPYCGSRLRAWKATSESVATWPSVPDNRRRDVAVAAALAAFDPAVPLQMDREGAPRGPVERHVTGRRARRPSPLRAAMAAAAAAAVIVGVSVGISQSGNGRGPSRASAPEVAATAPSAAPGVAGPATSAEGPATPVAGAVHPGSAPLGSYDSTASLVAALKARLAATPSAPAGSPAAPGGSVADPGGCAASARLAANVASGTAPVLDASLTYRGVASQVFVFAREGRHVVVVLGVTRCTNFVETTF